MNCPEQDSNLINAEEFLTPTTELSSPTALFMGDAGELGLETRRVLVQLLAGPFLDWRRHSKLWTVLLRDEAIIRRWLNELFLDLLIDHDMQAAFTRQADTGELEAPTLLRHAQLTFIDSILLLYPRQHLTQADSQGERAVVSVEDILEYVASYEQSKNTDQAGFKKRLLNSIEKIIQHHILQKIRFETLIARWPKLITSLPRYFNELADYTVVLMKLGYHVDIFAFLPRFKTTPSAAKFTFRTRTYPLGLCYGYYKKNLRIKI